MSEGQRQSESSSLKRQTSFRSIDEFRPSLLDKYSKTNRFPWRPGLNIMLILLSTFQIYILINSRVYLRGELVRTFLSTYFDGDSYSNLFDGEQFFVRMSDVQELSTQLIFTFNQMNQIEEDSFIDIDYAGSNMFLHVQYKEQAKNEKKPTIFPINGTTGITQPFDMNNLTSIQLFLLTVERFHLAVENLTVKENWEGFTQKYRHQIIYYYAHSIYLEISFLFEIDNALVSNEDDLSNSYEIDQSRYITLYIIKIKIFYAFIILLAVGSLYLNYLTIKRTFQFLYEELGEAARSDENMQIYGQNDEDVQIAKRDVKKWVKANNMTMNKMKFQHYFHLVEFDVIFSTLSNVFQIITGFYLISGIERERLAGIACLFSWLTIFRLIRQYKKLVLIYELIKLSLKKVANFFVQFFPVFLAYGLLGLCLFPKVSFFSSMSDSVTTLVCLMMGDSIEEITRAITEKNSTALAVAYIFSFVLLFMHAIHNTLTSLIKEFFLLKKIQLVVEEKQKNHQQDYIYIEQMKSRTQKMKDNLPLKLTTPLQLHLIRLESNKKINKFIQLERQLMNLLESIQTEEEWLELKDPEKMLKYREELKKRMVKVTEVKSGLLASDRLEYINTVSQSV